jgi:hypothetical protein
LLNSVFLQNIYNKMGKRIITITAAIIAFNSFIFAQNWKMNRYEAHFGIGTTNIFGDIGGTASANNLYGLKDIKIKETGFSLYGGIRFRIQSDMCLKLNLIYGQPSKIEDIDSKNADRQFSFKTTIFEPSVQYEYYFLPEYRNFGIKRLYNRRRMINNFSILSMYGFAGVGGLLFNPKLTYGGRPPLEGIEFVDNYGKFTIVVPLGLGMKFAYDKFWSFGFEFGRRFTFSDYIDGFSSTFSKNKDTYYFGVLHAIYKLETDRYGRPLLFKRRRFR